jgi:hypothetical protein
MLLLCVLGKYRPHYVSVRQTAVQCMVRQMQCTLGHGWHNPDGLAIVKLHLSTSLVRTTQAPELSCVRRSNSAHAVAGDVWPFRNPSPP